MDIKSENSPVIRDAVIGVVGAGQMGSGIALSCALAGYTTFLGDLSPTMLAKAKSEHQKLLEKYVQKETLSVDESIGVLERIIYHDNIGSLSSSSIVIEAVTENLGIKSEIFRALDALLANDSLIASNTSSISITKLAALTNRPDRCIGMHFMNPVPVMKLVEVIRGLQTSDETYHKIVALATSMNKTTVLAPDNAGFIVNRILVPMVNEALFLFQQGVAPKDIDTAMKLGTNQPMGPLELADFVGLDTLLSILTILHQELGEDKYRPCPLLMRYVEAGWLGRKAGKGIYSYL